jgi:ankyrin repeat protein
MQAAKENRDVLVRFIKTDTVFDRAWSHISGKDKEIDELYNRIQALVPQYEENYQKAILQAKAMGWKGNDENAPMFMIDLAENLHALVDAKVIEEKDIVRGSTGKIKIPETIENIKKGRLEKLYKIREECLAKGNINRLVQLGLFGLDFKSLVRPSLYSPFKKECLVEIFKYIDDFSNVLGELSDEDLEILTTLDKIPVADAKAAIELFKRICKLQDPKLVNELLQKLHRGGVDFTTFGQEPVVIAINENSLIVFKYLIDHGADVSSKPDRLGKSPLERLYKTMSIFGFPTEFDFLIELFKRRPDLAKSTEEFHGSHALTYAILEGKIHEAHELIRLGVNVNGKNNEPILLAIMRRDDEIVKALLDKGAMVPFLSVRGGGGTIIFDAVKHDHVYALILILNAGADIDAVDSNGDNALLYAMKNNFSLGVIRELIQNGINLHAVDKEGNNALHLAASLANKVVFKTLLEAGVDPYQKNNAGKTVIDLAKQYPDLKPLLEKNLKKKMP